MNKGEFYDKLKIVAPALSDSDLMPVLRCFWFTGKTLMAYNDHIAISIAFPTEFKGAVRGDSLLALIGVSGGGKDAKKKVTMSADDTQLHIKVGKTKIDLNLMTPDNFKVFTMPELDQTSAFPVDGHEFRNAVEQCMLSVSTDTSVADQLGVTLIPDSKQLLLFSTNNATLTHSHIKLKQEVNIKRVILPTMFCEQLLRLADGEELQLKIFDDHAMFRSGKVTVFGRLIDCPRPLDFVSIFARNMGNGTREKLVPMPRIKAALERAVIITESRVDRTKTELSVKDSKLTLLSKSESRGTVEDWVTLEGHDDVSIMVNPVLLKNGYPNFKQVLFTERCAIMTQDHTTYLIATTDD